MRILIVIGFLLMIVSAGCGTTRPALETVASVDLEKYAGTWYEIASFPKRYQRGCHCTNAEYVLTSQDYVRVINRCNKDRVEGKVDVAEGKAFPVEGSDNSKLRVQFFWPFRGDYWIIELDEDYTYAAVGAPDRESLWILSREPIMEPSVLQDLLQRLEQKLFNTANLTYTTHVGCQYHHQ